MSQIDSKSSASGTGGSSKFVYCGSKLTWTVVTFFQINQAFREIRIIDRFWKHKILNTIRFKNQIPESMKAIFLNIDACMIQDTFSMQIQN